MADGFALLAPFGPKVSAKTRPLINAKKKAIINGTFYEFTGPLYDQSGKLRVPKGKRMTLPQILTVDWLVKGVDREPQGLVGHQPDGSRASMDAGANEVSRPPRQGRPRGDARDHEAVPGRRRERRRRLRGGASGRSTRSSARTAPGRARCSNILTGLYHAGRGRDRALRPPGRAPLAARRARRRDRHGAPALSPRRAVHGGRERRPRRPPRRRPLVRASGRA